MRPWICLFFRSPILASRTYLCKCFPEVPSASFSLPLLNCKTRRWGVQNWFASRACKRVFFHSFVTPFFGSKFDPKRGSSDQIQLRGCRQSDPKTGASNVLFLLLIVVACPLGSSFFLSTVSPKMLIFPQCPCLCPYFLLWGLGF